MCVGFEKELVCTHTHTQKKIIGKEGLNDRAKAREGLHRIGLGAGCGVQEHLELLLWRVRG